MRLIITAYLLFSTFPAAAAITGSVMTNDGVPVAGAAVVLLPFESNEERYARLLAGRAEPEALARATSDAKGSFTLESPKVAVADLRVEAAGFEPRWQRVEKDEELGALLLRKAERKSGRVTANGKPVAEARVIWWGDTGSVVVATTDAQGRYSAPDPRNASAVTVLHPDYAVSHESFSPMSRAKSLDRTLVAGKPLTGRVVAEDGRTPVAKATISIDSWPVATTGDDGTFTVPHAHPRWKTLLARSGSLMALRSRPAKDDALTIRLAPAATILGTVRDARTPSGIAGAQVSVSSSQRRDDSGPSWNVLTDAKGNYRLSVPPGTYQLSSRHPSYTASPLEASAAAGQSVTKDVTMTPWARVAGTLLDEERKPVAAALIAPKETSSDPLTRIMLRESTAPQHYSGPDGRFVVRLRGDADLRLHATKKGLPEGKSDPLRLATGERKRGVVITMPSGMAVSGRVTDRDGNALSGVIVTPSESESNAGGGFRRMVVLRGDTAEEEDPVTTGSDGTFAMRLREGTYDFTFRREGYSSKSVRAHAVGRDTPPVETSLDPAVEITGRVVRGGVGLEGVTLFVFAPDQQSSAVTGPDGSFTLSGLTPGMTRVSLRKEDEFIQDQRNLTAPGRDVLVEIAPGGQVSGRVVDKATKRPVTSFQAGISTSRSMGGSMAVNLVSPPLLRSFESDDGSFVLENVPAGAVNLVVTAPGYAQGKKGGLTLEEGKSLTGVEVELDTGVKLTGRVTAPDGSALGGVSVRVAPSGGRSMVMGPNDPRGTTESNGEYVLDGLDAGERTIEFSHGKYLTARKTVELTGRETRLDMRMESGARASGTVVTDAGQPVADATVELEGAGVFGRSVKTDANGAFVMDTLQPGRYTFRASRNGYSSGKVTDVDITSGQPIRITLGQGGILYGRVSGVSPEEYPYTIVEARASQGSSSAAVDSSGSYRIEGAPVGTVRVLATTSRDFTARRSSQPRTVEVRAGTSEQVDLEFRTDVSVRGRVIRDGRPLGGATVNFNPRGGTAQTFASASADDQGNYVLTGLDDGEYSVMVMDSQRLTPYTTRYTVSGSGTFDIDYRTSGIRGRIVDAATGDPIADARVQVRSTGNEVMFATRGAMSDAGGAFAFDFVPAGGYVVMAEKEGYGNEMSDVRVSDGAAQDVELELSRNDGVVLTVVDGRDNRPIGASVSVLNGAGQIVYESFRFGDSEPMRLPLNPGTYRVMVFANGYAPRTVEVTSPSSQRVPLTPGGSLLVRYSKSERARARLVDANGAVYGRSPRQNWYVVEASPSTTTIEHVAPGTYTLQILGPDDAVLDQIQVTAGEGAAVTVDI